jgi:hypothetical protein
MVAISAAGWWIRQLYQSVCLYLLSGSATRQLAICFSVASRWHDLLMLIVWYWLQGVLHLYELVPLLSRLPDNYHYLNYLKQWIDMCVSEGRGGV